MAPLQTEALIDRVMDGDLTAYGEIVLRHQAEVWAVTSALLTDRTRAEDLVQQTFVRAYHQLSQYERGRDFGAWLRAIARNLARNELRRSGREGNLLALYHAELELQLMHDADNSERRERLLTALERCLAALPEPAARVVELRYEQGLEFEEIARTLNRTVPASRQFLSRARLWLRDCLGQELKRS
jgi:RNA polymerase sigma-70 factor, ECF subfamily